MSMQPAKKTKSKRRNNRKRYSKKKGSKVALPKRTTGSFATRMEQFSIGVTAGVSYDFNLNLNDLPIARQLSQLYQYYRITSVEMRFKPYFDTYANGISNGQTLPYLNFQYDKAGNLGGMTAPQFEEIGTKAIRFDDKTIVRKWRPSVPTNTELGTTQFKVSPWLPTHSPVTPTSLNIIDHHGAVFYISKMSPSDATAYDVDVVVNVQFRKPLVLASSESVQPPRVIQTNETVITIPTV